MFYGSDCIEKVCRYITQENPASIFGKAVVEDPLDA